MNSAEFKPAAIALPPLPELIDDLRRYADLLEDELVVGWPRKVGDAADHASPLMRQAAAALEADRAAHAIAPCDAKQLVIEFEYATYAWQIVNDAANLEVLEMRRAALLSAIDRAARALTQGEPVADADCDTTSKGQYKRMFNAACEALGLINEALGLDPEDGGHEPILDAIARLAATPGEPAGWRSALKFYANKYHFMLADESAWDTVSGEPSNYWCDEAGTATMEDGTVAAMALAGTPLPDEDDESPAPQGAAS